jgi:hypothetical protein
MADTVRSMAGFGWGRVQRAEAMSEKPKMPPMEVQLGSSGWRHMPLPVGSFCSVKSKVELAPPSEELRQATAEPMRRDALKKQRIRLAETRHQKG